MSSRELSTFFQAHDVVQKFEPMYSGSFVSLFWKGDDILGEKQIPSSGVIIKMQDEKVICVFYGFQYDKVEFVERRRKGSCSEHLEI